MSHISIDLINLYKTYFGSSFSIGEEFQDFRDDRTLNSIPISKKNATGIEIFLPVTLWISEYQNLQIDCCTIRITSKKTIVRTAVSERQGTVKELFNIGDYVFTIKGVLMGKNKQLPDEKIFILRGIYESTDPIYLHNALAEIFMPQCRVAVESLEFPEVEGKSVQHRPFVLVCETDYVDTLTLNE